MRAAQKNDPKMKLFKGFSHLKVVDYYSKMLQDIFKLKFQDLEPSRKNSGKKFPCPSILIFPQILPCLGPPKTGPQWWIIPGSSHINLEYSCAGIWRQDWKTTQKTQIQHPKELPQNLLVLSNCIWNLIQFLPLHSCLGRNQNKSRNTSKHNYLFFYYSSLFELHSSAELGMDLKKKKK